MLSFAYSACFVFCLAESSGGLPKATTRMLEASPEITMDDLRCSVAGFAAAHHETTKGSVRGGAGEFKAVPTPANTLEDFSADFVTPGDLFRSNSLTTIGTLDNFDPSGDPLGDTNRLWTFE